MLPIDINKCDHGTIFLFGYKYETESRFHFDIVLTEDRKLKRESFFYSQPNTQWFVMEITAPTYFEKIPEIISAIPEKKQENKEPETKKEWKPLDFNF